MDDIVLAPAATSRLEAFLRRPSHGVLLDGPSGVGLKTIALYIAQKLGARHDDIRMVLPDEKGTITIERVRELYAMTRTSYDQPRVIIINDAESMGIPAQNALLKVLEEPTERTHFILTTHYPQQLLPTITSRVQQLTIPPVSLAESDQLIVTSEAAKQAQLRFLAQGLPAELLRLQHDETYFATATLYMKDARAFLEGDSYARLILAKEYSTERGRTEQFLLSLLRLMQFMLFRQKNLALTPHLELVETILTRINANAHLKTQLMYLVTKLG